MKKEVHPAVIAVAAVVLIAVLGFFMMRSLAPHEIAKPNNLGAPGVMGRLERYRARQGQPSTAPVQPQER